LWLPAGGMNVGGGREWYKKRVLRQCF